MSVCERVHLLLWCVCPRLCVDLRLYPPECACCSGVSVTSLHHITMQPWHLWQPSEASNLIKTEINLISDLPDEYDKTCSRLMDLDTYQGPGNHWSWIRGGRDWGGGVRGSKTWWGLVEAALERCSQAGLGWQPWLGDGPKLLAKPPSLVCGREEGLILSHSLTHTAFCFSFPVFNSPILSHLHSSVSLTYSCRHSLLLFLFSVSHTHSHMRTLTHRDLGDI